MNNGVVGDFLVRLYQKRILKEDFKLKKNSTRPIFREYLLSVKCKTINFIDVGTALRNHGFLINTPRGSDFFQIHKGNFFKFLQNKLKTMDFECINSSAKILSNINSNQKIEEKENELEVDPESEVFSLFYQESVKDIFLKDFSITNLGCYICQKNFPSQDDFEDHVKNHQEEDSDLISIKGCTAVKQVLELSYCLCKKSHYFCFQMKTKSVDVIIDKIIIVQTCSMEYVKYIESNGDSNTTIFYVDSHMFSLRVQQPIVIVFHYKSNTAHRYIEKHFFWRTENLPKVCFPTKSIRLCPDKSFKRKIKILQYFPSDKMKQAHKQHFTLNSLCEASQPFKNYIESNKEITENNIVTVFRVLLQIEDLETTEKYLHLSQINVKVKGFGQDYSVKLKKNKKVFEENVIKPMDEIVLMPVNDNFDEKKGKKRYVAAVEKVYDDCVCFRYEGSANAISDDNLYNIIFRPSRFNIIYQHRALDLLSYDSVVRKMLFPNCVQTAFKTSGMPLELYNQEIEHCPEQLQAVRNIAEGTAQQVPYIVFGPPGTGKTTTIVESILQLWKRDSGNKILVTAGSNSACDVVALRLCKTFAEIDPENRNLLRIYSKSNEKNLDTIEDLLLESSNMYNVHFYPSVELIHEYRIIICTLSIVGKLVTGDFAGNEFFSHIFVDEVAASTEPEVLVGIMGTLSKSSQLIISGDHKQLGAVLQSSLAMDYGLNVSMMERLLARSCYEVDINGQYNRNIQTRLIKNYRSHKEIVKLYSTLYYDGELQPMLSSNSVNLGSMWHLLPNENFPILFHSVRGRSIKNNTSMRNTAEITIILNYLRELMFLGIDCKPMAQTDIGIISPYKAQCKLIQEELNKRHWYQIEVGSVETFQGKEKPVIIVSLVRSFVKTLGFLESPKRLNVTLSRAQSLLIIIGNPETLSMNKDYKHVIDHCRINKSLVGSSAGSSKEMSKSRESITKQNKNSPESGNNSRSPTPIPQINYPLEELYKIRDSLPSDDILLGLPSVPKRSEDCLRKPTSIVKPIVESVSQSKQHNSTKSPWTAKMTFNEPNSSSANHRNTNPFEQQWIQPSRRSPITCNTPLPRSTDQRISSNTPTEPHSSKNPFYVHTAAQPGGLGYQSIRPSEFFDDTPGDGRHRRNNFKAEPKQNKESRCSIS